VKRIAAALVVAAVVPGAAACASGTDRRAGGVTVERGIVYREAPALGGGRARLKLDLYRPEGVRHAPVVIWVHGGGFTGGRREDMGPYAQAMADRGFESATISYRLGRRPGGGRLVRAAEHDLDGAVAWFRRHRRSLGIDSRRLFVGGYSAGAVTSLRVALRGRPRVRGAVIIAGALSGAPVARRAAPVIWFHGSADHTVPYAAARSGCRTARTRGRGCRLVMFHGVGHEVVATRFGAIVTRASGWLERRR
jgi:acetyl esterase/lipase